MSVYQTVLATGWPSWGSGADLSIGFGSRGLPGGLAGDCVKPHHMTSFGCESQSNSNRLGFCGQAQGNTYSGGAACSSQGVCSSGPICGGDGNWGATDVEVWYPRGH